MAVRSTFFAGALLLATAAHAADFTPAEIEKFSAEMVQLAKDRSMALPQINIVAPVLCRNGCLVMTPNQYSEMMLIMVAGMKAKIEEACPAPGATYAPSPGFAGAPGTHPGVNKLP